MTTYTPTEACATVTRRMKNDNTKPGAVEPAPTGSEPSVGREYWWDFGGTKPELVKVHEVMKEHVPERTNADGSMSAGHTRIIVRISKCGWAGWFGGRGFEVVEWQEPNPTVAAR